MTARKPSAASIERALWPRLKRAHAKFSEESQQAPDDPFPAGFTWGYEAGFMAALRYAARLAAGRRGKGK